MKSKGNDRDAALERENAELRRQLAESLSRQQAVAEVLQVINSSPGDLAPVFDSVLEKAMRLCTAAFGYLMTYDGERFHEVAHRGLPPAFAEYLPRMHQPGSSGMYAHILQGAPFVQSRDLSEGEVYQTSPLRQALVNLGGARTGIVVALRRDEALLGVITIYRQEVRPFSDSETSLLQNFAAQAVIAMENARLLAETREALDQQTATAEVLQAISRSTFDLRAVLQTVVSAAHRLCQSDHSVIFRKEGDEYRWAAGYGISAEYEERERRAVIRPGTGSVIGRAVLAGHAVQIADAKADPLYQGEAESEARAMLGVPLLRDGVAIGGIGLARNRVEPFTDKQVQLVTTFADQAVIAIENARLLTETREALDQQTATAEVLQVISRSTFDLQLVLDTLIETAAVLCGAKAATGIAIRQGDVYRHVAMFSHDPEWVARVKGTTFVPDRRTIGGRVALEGEVIHVTDLTADPEYDMPEAVTIGGMRTLLGVPLLREGEPIGVLLAGRETVQPFTERQIELLRSFADQAVIAIENTRLITETREALDQQTATAEVLGVINSSPGDLAPVFEAMLEKALRLCDARTGHLLRYVEGSFSRVASLGIPDDFDKLLPLNQPLPHVITRDSVPYRTLATRAPINVVDLREDDSYRAGAPAETAAVDDGGVRSVLFVPLLNDEEVVGNFVMHRLDVRPFTDKQIALLQNFAAQAVIAMENARLITETRGALEHQTAVSEVLEIISSSPGQLQPVFDAVLANAVRICGGAFGLFGLWENDGFRGVATSGVGAVFADALSRIHRPPPGTSLNLALVTKQTIHQPDCATDPAYDPVRAFNPDFAKVRTNLTVPMLWEGEFLGALAIYRDEVRPFDPKQIELVENFAKQAVIAMENARLITETREALEQQTATAEVLGVINSSPGNLAPVFASILEKAHDLCGAVAGSLVVYDGEFFRAVKSHGLPEQYAALLRQPFRPNTIHQPLLLGERFVYIPDYAAVDMKPGEEVTQSFVELTDMRTVLHMPMRKDGTLLGYIAAVRQEARAFSEKEIALLENFAAQAVIAMENARLLTETRERSLDLQESLEYQTAISEVLKVISQSTFDLQPVLDTLVATARGLCNADMAMIYRRQGDAYRLAANLGFPAEYEAFARNLSLTASRASVTQRAALERRISHVPDIVADPEYALPEASQLGKARTALGVPLLREGEPIGVFTLARERVEPFAPRQIELVRTFADQAVIAMENARLLGELRQRTEEVAELNRGLEARVAEAVDELGRVGRLKRFLAPQLAELIVSQGDEKILESHRREIVVVFCDLRGYTAFTETAEPEEVLDFLREYHGALGPLVAEYEGTLDQFSGDGIMVFFNDPVPIPDPAERAVKMAMAMRETASALTTVWRRRGRELGFGAGIAQGYATLGQIGFSERSGYTAIGTVCNVAARLCAEAKDGQILLSQRVAAGLDGDIALEEIGPLPLKGITQPVIAFNVAPAGGGMGHLRLVEP